MAHEEQEEGEVKPQVNDPVSFHVEGVVTAINGDMADVSVAFVNGERPGEPHNEPEEKTESDDVTEEDLTKAAKAADEEKDY